MAMYPFHCVDSIERKAARQHLVEGDTERVEIATRVNRSIHSARLLRGHVGKCPGNELWGSGCLPFARDTRRHSKAREPGRSIAAVHQNIGGLNVLVDQTSLVHLADDCSDIDSKAQEPLNCQRRIQGAAEQLPSGVFEYQNSLAVFLHELQRTQRPSGVEAFGEFVLVSKPV